ncbi:MULTISPECIES: hypothetical protein [Streptomyces]|uniref:hypothetical protein n=1 Tax=Streptomyces TaxID=1883 RepID=UPI00345B6D35
MTNQVSGTEVVQQEGAWTVRMWWPDGPIMGGPQRVTVEPAVDAPPGDVARGISTTILRRVNPVAAAEKAKVDAPESAGPAEFARRGSAVGALLSREGVSTAYLVALASLYKDMADSGAKALTPDLARFIDRRPDTLKAHLKQARRDGFLTTVTGKAGGELTPKARAVLADLDLDSLAEPRPQG